MCVRVCACVPACSLVVLQDFSGKWLDAVKGKTKDPVCVRVYEEADGIRKAVPALKFARGDPFKEDHWSQVFKKLGMPKGIKLETLTVGHFLDCVPQLVANTQVRPGAVHGCTCALVPPRCFRAVFATDSIVRNWHERWTARRCVYVRACVLVVQFLKELQSRAQGEVTIREALQELKAWAETSEFALLDHVSSGSGKKTFIIQQWKDLFTEVGDNQSLLQVRWMNWLAGVVCLQLLCRRVRPC